MSSLIGRLRAFRESPHFSRILKFGTVSLVATAVSQTTLFIFYPHLVASAMGSNVIATAISTVPAYYLNRVWTWGKRGKSHLWKEVVPFWAMAFVGLVFSTVIVGIAAKNADRISSSHEVKVAVVHFANLFAYALIWVARYSLLNRFLFGAHTHQPDADGPVVDTVAVERPRSAMPATADVSGSRSASASSTSSSASATVSSGAEPELLPVDPSR